MLVGSGDGVLGLRVWLLPIFRWAFPGGKGCESDALWCIWLRPKPSSPLDNYQAACRCKKTAARKDTVHDEKTVQRFIELRSAGWTFVRLTTELGVSKPTLIAWSRKHRFQIQNLKAIEMESLNQKWLASATERVNELGTQLQQVDSLLKERDLSQLTTPQLLALSRQLREQIERTTGPMQFIVPIGEIPNGEYHEQMQQWTA